MRVHTEELVTAAAAAAAAVRDSLNPPGAFFKINDRSFVCHVKTIPPSSFLLTCL